MSATKSGLINLELQTERLIIKVINNSFAENVAHYLLKNKYFFREWTPLTSEKIYTSKYQTKKLNKEVEKIRDGTFLKLWLFRKDEISLHNIIGDITFSNIIYGTFLSCFLSYKLDFGHIDKGYMSEALKIAINFAFSELKLHRLEANIMPKNINSIILIEKLGFEKEGYSKKYLKINGVWEDHLRYALLNENDD